MEWRSGGYLFVAYDAEREKSFKDLLVIQKAAGLGIDWISPERVRELAPGIKSEGLLGGTYSPGDGYASPLIVSTVVNAAGADAAELASLVDLEIPVHPDCHEAGVSEPVARFMEPMLVDIRPDHESGNYYFYQADTGQIVFCITPKPTIWGSDADITSGFLPLALRRMVELYPLLRNLKVRRTWRGMYPMTPDGLPIVAYPQGLENFLLAVGMCGQGFMLGPGLGEILAQLIADGKPSERNAQILEELTLYRKFSGMEMLK